MNIPVSVFEGQVLRPDIVPFAIELDEAALMEKERRDRSRLEVMIRYANARECRQGWIREYFGEADVESCGSCDNCKQRSMSNLRVPDDMELVQLRKLLSGVARMSRRLSHGGWEPRFGRQRIAEMLVGSRNEKVLSAGLDQLSTYGLLEKEGMRWVRDLLEECIRCGLLCVSSGEHPMVTLTDSGEAVMMGRKQVPMAWPDLHRKVAAKVVPRPFSLEAGGVSVDDELLKKLRRKRMQLCQVRPGLKPYQIFPNKTLEALAAARPKTVEQALLLPGIGPEKARKYLPAFLRIINGVAE
ncbi:MAG: HRDC domain-containing protein [Verrucomicrobia bacterium]|nr:HRDC domain-containing protein [Verrucomicrobiota bacterium]